MADGDVITYRSAGGVTITRTTLSRDVEGAVDPYTAALDTVPGVVLTSSYEVPGRYTRWSRALADPPVAVISRDRTVWVRALNDRGIPLIALIRPALASLAATTLVSESQRDLVVEVDEVTGRFAEEQRSQQPSVFTVLRALIGHFAAPEEHLGLYGAFGYDLVFQFEPIARHQQRADDQRDLVLFLPDELLVVDHALQRAVVYRYDFSDDSVSTEAIGRRQWPVASPAVPATVAPGADRDHEVGEYAALVRIAQESFRRGDLFEVVPGQLFRRPAPTAPSALFRSLVDRNPAPFGALINLGDDEFLVSASPEMYVRVEGTRVESCPISGTIARGTDVLTDSERILELLNSEKDASELTMCTDVDRNDKSRICVPGSVQVIGRRQIELYSKLIHTVDHVEGTLRPEFDALDAFLTHMWAVTVTGAPKLWAMRFIEEHEKSPRRWYGGALGYLNFNGDLTTGLTIRTIRIADGVAEVRAGATLLADSDPDAEERETELKASAFLKALDPADADEPEPEATPAIVPLAGAARRVLFVDHEDSFVHTLANYFRQAGAQVRTLRAPLTAEEIAREVDPALTDLLVLSPGPGRPTDFRMDELIGAAVTAGVPVFGVCLGLQGIVEHFGGQLGILPFPSHGRESTVRSLGGGRLTDVPETFTAGRYHSLIAERASMPDELIITAETEDGIVMAVEHRSLPIAGVQFHPESLMTARDGVGLALVRSVLDTYARTTAASHQ